MMHDGYMKYVEEAREPGASPRIVQLEDFSVDPFGFHDLANAKPHKPLSLSVNIRDAKIGKLSENIEIHNKRVSAQFTLNSHLSSKSYVLVSGGWFPPGFTSKKSPVYLLDRCAYNDLRAKCKNGPADFPEKDFIEHLRHPGTKINVLPLLMEGNQRRRPTAMEIIAQYNEVSKEVMKALPECELVPSGLVAVQAAMNMVSDRFVDTSREQSFLIDIAHHLVSPVGKGRRQEVLRYIRESGRIHGVDKSSLAYLASVSSVLCGQSRNPGNGILKPKRSFTAEDLHNALSDLSILKLLIGMISLFPDYTPCFCTSDKNLALFWVGLGLGEFRWQGNEITFNYSVSNELFPGLPAEYFD